MIGLIVASHGDFAAGLVHSAQMMFGDQEALEIVSFQPHEGPDDLKNHLEEALGKFAGDQDVLILCDLWGGSPFNQASLLHDQYPDRTAIVTGMNLPMILEALGMRMTMDSAHELAKELLSKDKSGINVLPESLKPAETVTSLANSQPASDSNTGLSADEILPPGTVLGDGQMKYDLVRVDSRLLHGQVVTNWAKRLNPDRIIVVSDTVARDDMRKGLIQQAAPSGMKAHTVPLEKFVELDKDPRFGNTHALLLFENPQDVLEVMKQGVKFNEVNLGSMAHSEGKVMLSNALSVDQDDIDTIREIQAMGATLDIRKVPADNRENFEQLVKKANLN